MNVRYKKEANAAYMILEGSTECETYAARMLQENRIRGVMPLTIHQVDGVKEYYFDISCGRSMSGVLEKRPVTMSEVTDFLHALAKITDQMDEYLMNIAHLILEPGMICLPMENRRGSLGYDHLEADFSGAVFCCHPAVEKDFLGQVRDLIQYFLNKMDHMEEQSIEKAYELFRISQKEYFRIEELLAICDTAEKPAPRRTEPVTSAGNALSRPEPVEKEIHEKTPSRGDRWKMLTGVALMFGGVLCCLLDLMVQILSPEWSVIPDTGFLWLGVIFLIAGGGITLFGAPQSDDHRESRRGKTSCPALISQNYEELSDIYIRKLPFTLGKNRETVDGALDWPTVSRNHARIGRSKGGYYLEDCKSTNGTYLNGAKLEPEQPYPLHLGDEVTLADCRFIFRVV